MRGSIPKLTTAQSDQLIDWYLAGQSMQTIGDKLNVSLVTVRNYLRRHDVPIRRPGVGYYSGPSKRKGSIAQLPIKEIADLWVSGVSQKDLCARYDVGLKAIKRTLARANISESARKLRRAHDGRWKGGRIQNQRGYVSVIVDTTDPLAPMRNCIGYVFEHRLVMARHLKRPLTENETVHHINGDPSNNEITNLQLRTGQHGKGAAMVCLDCGSYNVAHVPLSSPLDEDLDEVVP